LILNLTPNPSLDRIAIVPGFSPGRAFHAAETRWYAGGKGFHFLRALRTLGEAGLLVGPLGGHIGCLLRQQAEVEKLDCVPVWISGETRTGLVVFDSHNRVTTELYEPGPHLQEQEWELVQLELGRRIKGARLLVICGSLPEGVPLCALATVVQQASQAGIPALLDTYGAQFREALSAKPALVKINHREAGELLDVAIHTPKDGLQAAAAIQALGAQSVVITLGALGAVGVDPYGAAFGWAAPKVEAGFEVGCGDSFFAGLASGLVKSLRLQEAARLAVAVGSANALTLGPGVFERSQVDSLLEEVIPL
jgi:1-phosphofructokinase